MRVANRRACHVRRSPRSLRSLTVVCASAALGLAVAADAAAGAQVSTYVCKLGEAPRMLAGPAQERSPQELEDLRAWDVFAMRAIAQAVRGQAPLGEALPLFRALLRAGPFAGAFAKPGAAADPFLQARGVRFLDAAARMAHGPPIALVRKLLQDRELVARLRGDTYGAAHHAADYVLTHYFSGSDEQGARDLFLPVLLARRNSLSDRDLVDRSMRQIDGGHLGPGTADMLARTFLWDLRLYLLGKPGEQELNAALARDDGALGAELVSTVSAMHLRYFLFGSRESKQAVARWRSFEADRFIRERAEFTWVGQAAALAFELEHGTAIRITGDVAPSLSAGGTTGPLVYSAEPAWGGSFAVARIPTDGADSPGAGSRWADKPALAMHPPLFRGPPTPSGLHYVVELTTPGQHRLSYRYSIYGLELPVISVPVSVGRGEEPKKADPTQPAETWAPEEVIFQLTTPPSGHRVVYNSGQPVGPLEQPVINGASRLFEFADGQHAMGHTVLYEVRVSAADRFPKDFTYCSPNPHGDEAARKRAMDEVNRIVNQPLGRVFRLATQPAAVVGTDCWVGRKGKGADGRTYYVLCRGRQVYYKRNEAYVHRTYWDALLGEQSLYDTEQTKGDTEAIACTVLAGLGAIGKPRGEASSTPPATQLLGEVRQILTQDANLIAQLDLVVAAWRSKHLGDEEATASVAENIRPAYDALLARAAALTNTDGDLQSLLEDLKAALSVGIAAAHLVEGGISQENPEKATRGMKLLHSYDDRRQELRMRSMTLGLRGREGTSGPTAPREARTGP